MSNFQAMRYEPDQPPRVRASCTVEPLGRQQWEVRAWGEPPYDHERVYTLNAPSDNAAAAKGMRLFVDEMENL